MAARCYDFTQLGYLGADIVLDARLGPMLLELNARPGLTIQIANQCGLRKRVDPFKDADDKMPAEERVAYALNVLKKMEDQ
jgi:D-alanine-D-alanine ligase-like ATP-grasp enzyme